MHPPAKLCAACKGTRNLCGLGYCPILEKIKVQKRIFTEVKSEVFGPSPPNIFVGSRGYPYINVGFLASDSEVVDNPREMYGWSLNRIVEERSKVYRTAVKRNVFAKDKYISDIQEVVLSTKPVDVEIKFKNKPEPTINFSPLTQPMGPTGIIENYEVVGNAKIPSKVDEIKEERLTATEGIKELLNKGLNNYYITRVFNAGILGQEDKRKLVPTRWSITAVDDMISKEYMKHIREYPEVNDITIFRTEYLHNKYGIMILPGKWEFENFEAWARGSLWNLSGNETYIAVEYEPHQGRWKYAESQAGGYYASRFAITEWLYRIRRQAKVVVIREVASGYMVPVGVWQVRENVRQALVKGGIRVGSLNEGINLLSEWLDNPINEYIRRSRILGQTNITIWI